MEDHVAASWTFAGVGAVLLLGGGVALALAVRGAARIVRLARDGVRQAAEIVALRVAGRGTDRRPRYRLTYRYDDAAGVSHEGRSRMGPARRFEGLRPGHGATIYVDPDKPSVSVWSGDLG